MCLLAAGYIRTNANRFAPCIMDDLGAVDAAAYCHCEVEPPGKDAEQVQIIALTEALGVDVRIESCPLSAVWFYWKGSQKCKQNFN